MSIKIRNITIGDKPLICAPVISSSEKDILDDVRIIKAAPVDIIEWRADYFDECGNYARITEALENIRKICGDIPLIFTYRMKDEGGETDKESPITADEYVKLIKHAAGQGCADMIDIQVMSLKSLEYDVKELISDMHIKGVKVIASNHHFDRTPQDDEMKEIFEIMHKTGADILKLAVMPKYNTDVIRLMSVTAYASANYSEPVITMSMGKLGVISRIAGSITGSAVTFASVKGKSAPGQIPAGKLSDILEMLYL